MPRASDQARFLLLAAALAVSLGLPSGAAAAQGSRLKEEWTMATATRDELEGKAIEAEQVAAMPQTPSQLRRDKLAAAQSIRTRLSQGDFQAGDRIVLRITGDPNVKPEDTVTVRPGSVLLMPQMGEISLRGVLRSELAALGSSRRHCWRHRSSSRSSVRRSSPSRCRQSS